MTYHYRFLNPKVTLLKSEKLFSYPADKRLQLTAFSLHNNQQVDRETLNRMFDKNTNTQFTGEEVGEHPGGLTFHLDHHSIFKRLTVTFKPRGQRFCFRNPGFCVNKSQSQILDFQRKSQFQVLKTNAEFRSYIADFES